MKRIPVLTTLTALIALWTITVFGLVPSVALGAVPHLLNFQGVLKDANGNPVADGSYPVLFEIFNSVGPGGGCLWLENQAVTTQGGLFSVVLGSTSPVGIPDTAFNGPDRWLAITVGNDPEISPRQRLTSVGYSYRVGTVDGATGGTIFGNTSIQSDLAVAGAMNAKNMVLQDPGPIGTPLSIQGSAGQSANLMEIKDASGAPMVSVQPDGSFEIKQGLFKRFAVFGHNVQCYESLKVDGDATFAGNFQTSGISEVGGQDALISLSKPTYHSSPVGIGTAPSATPDIPLRVESGSTLHELGHTLGIHHEGPVGSTDDFLQAWDESGNKVAHISSMGYLYNTGINVGSGGINTSGDVGIGTSAPNSTLQIGGSIALRVDNYLESEACLPITLDKTHSVVLLGGPGEPSVICDVNLPSAVGIQGRMYFIKKVGPSASYKVYPVAGQTIDGNAFYFLSGLNQFVCIVSDGANWWIIGNNTSI